MKPRLVTPVLAALIGLIATVLFAAQPAGATVSNLCTGYSGCAAAGYGNGGYSGASGTSYWGMTAGHNCTNYAAYRLIQNGVDASYLRGQGNAWQWGGVAAAHGVAVDGSPRVGDIAWWNKNVGGHGSLGHVSYVEQVGAGYIVTSEDNYGGDFHWVKITGANMPSGFIHFGGTGSSSGNQRIGALTGGSLNVKDGSATAPWTTVATDVSSFALSPNRIVVRLANGAVQAKEGGLSSGWITETSNADAIGVTDTRLAVLSGGTLTVKEGGLGATWTTVATGVSRFALSPNRIAVLLTSGALQVKEGPLTAGWVTETTNVSDFAVTDNRVAAVSGGVLNVKEGDLGAAWLTVTSGVAGVAMSPNRLVIRSSDGTASVKEGPLNATWTVIGGGSAMAVTDSRIGLVEGDGTFVLKDGPVNATWLTEITNASAIALA